MFKRMSFKMKLSGMVLVAVAMMAAGGIYSLEEMSFDFERSIQDDFPQQAKTLGERIGTQYYERYGDVQAFALNSAIRRMELKDVPAILDSYVTLYGIYDLILVVDKTGRPLASNVKSVSGKEVNVKALREMNFADAAWFKEVMAGRTTDEKEKNYSGTYFEPFINDPIMKTAFGEAAFTSGFSAAVRNENGEIVGVITNRANPAWFEAELKNTYQDLKSQGLSSATILLAQKDGLVVAELRPSADAGAGVFNHDPARILKYNVKEMHEAEVDAVLKGESGYGEIETSRGTEIAGYHMIENSKWPKSLGWSVILHAERKQAFHDLDVAMRIFYIATSLAFIFAMSLALYFAFGISKSVVNVTNVLAENSSEVADAAQSIGSSSTQLSESATEQAAALQETVAAVDEISAMVEKNAEAAGRSQDVSRQSRETAEKGRTIVDNMLSAIQEIDQANSEISNQMETNARQLGEITALINDIGSKTKVINEIVFQTKLLSFNASVEAARAGEYGKGFAVVAEEVGSLAEMSGNAAKEISTLLETSVRKVESIVSESRVRVDRMMSHSKDKVQAGSTIARECNDALLEILQNVQAVDTLVSEIAVASNEQSTGIREISKAVGQLEQVTQQNSSVAQSSAGAAEQLTAQSESLRNVVGDLAEIVHGERSEQMDAPAPVAVKTRKPAKVIAMTRKEASVSQPVAMKKAAGSEGTPSSDDPGFSE